MFLTMLCKIGENTYKIQLVRDVNTYVTFVVGDLTPYIKYEID